MSIGRVPGSALRDLLNMSGYSFDVWPTVDPGSLSQQHRNDFFRRRDAVHLYAKGINGSEIKRLTGLSIQQVIRLIKNRCLLQHPDGRLFGYRGLIPHLRVTEYKRSSRIPAVISAGGDAAGGFRQLLRRYPDLERKLQDRILKIKDTRLSLHQSREPINRLHAWFINECRKLGLEERNEYPFNTKWQGYVSLTHHVKRVISQYPKQAAQARFGMEAAKRIQTGDGVDNPVTRPLQRVECDAHKIDGLFCVLIPTPFGELVPKLIHRLWVIAIKEVMSRCILGYHLSLNFECNQFDLLRAIHHALSPAKLRELTIPKMAYAPGAGFPSSRFPRFIGACWEEMSVDEAMINRSHAVVESLRDVVGSTTLVLPRHSPNDRPFVERFFGALETAGFQRLPNTTGNSPEDPRRNNPEKVSVQWQFQLEQAEELLDVLFANFNATPHHSLGYRTPLDYLAFLAPEGRQTFKTANPDDVKTILSIRKVVTVKGGVRQGRHPYVQYLGARYSSDVLRRSHHLVGKKVTLIANEDLRTVQIYHSNGSSLGTLRAGPPWHRVPHTRAIRQAVLSLANRKLLHLSASTDPVLAFIEYAESNLQKKLTVSPAYLEARRILVEHLDELREWEAPTQPSDFAPPPSKTEAGIHSCNDPPADPPKSPSAANKSSALPARRRAAQ